ncbi:glycosyltransferase family 2 protein [Dactylosporangium sp. CA-092794]|uniref:glycosyltransferase family 2 protein n=1 Tax=Dactylosporangium sp. CA-092794 TaxID=3239929 RepID=UPI003D8E750F
MTSIAIVIVTYNSAAVLGGCLNSLPSEGVDITRVVVVDNNSKDDSVAIARAAAGQLPIRCVQTGRNAGYAAAVNAGVATLADEKYDAIWVMNPDTRLRPDTLRILVDALSEPRRGIVVPKILNPDGTLQPSLRRKPTVGRALAEAVVGARAGRLGTIGELITDPREYAEPRTAVWATGAAMLLGAEMVREIGGWDESLLLYSEETEYALRAADHGWSLWFDPRAVVEHIGGESGTNPKLAALLVVNKVRLFKRRHTLPAAGAYYAAVMLGEGMRALQGRRTSRASLAALMHPKRPPKLGD